jgi:hypothetical protein
MTFVPTARLSIDHLTHHFFCGATVGNFDAFEFMRKEVLLANGGDY